MGEMKFQKRRERLSEVGASRLECCLVCVKPWVGTLVPHKPGWVVHTYYPNSLHVQVWGEPGLASKEK